MAESRAAAVSVQALASVLPSSLGLVMEEAESPLALQLPLRQA